MQGTKATDIVELGGHLVSNYGFLVVDRAQGLAFLQADGVCGFGRDEVEGFMSLIQVLFEEGRIR